MSLADVEGEMDSWYFNGSYWVKWVNWSNANKKWVGSMDWDSSVNGVKLIAKPLQKADPSKDNIRRMTR